MPRRKILLWIAIVLAVAVATHWLSGDGESTAPAVAQSSAAPAAADSGCLRAVADLNRHLAEQIDEAELAAILVALNRSNNRELPGRYVTKAQARQAGWRPGDDLWAHPALKGKSIGGDRFSNRENQLPAGGRSWRELDLDYKGGHRGAKRMVFSSDGLRYVTVDHYRTFVEVPPCP
ncbi:MAG TPA: ribonuclease domain-containing protein [bacterium]|nr:ribonuclease domain-containing protein [bacterium]HQG46936.1 ribonuclease domain-containing protein [bacterium]HQI49425.1 ribonuclease domain-containing protein [bacterium]HQJ65290.1 ribonuclease domain-containing protein [bacterium]